MIDSKSPTTSHVSFQTLVAQADWEFADADTQYLTHNLHRYSGKFIPQIARQAIEYISAPEDTILDPYMGSGTTLLEAALVGRRSIGVDLNPLAVLIASAKVRPVDEPRLRSLVEHFRNLTGGLDAAPGQLTLLPDERTEALLEEANRDEKRHDPWYTKWFNPEVLLQLLVLHRAIAALSDADCSRIAMVAFSDILRRCSNAHSSYPNVMFVKRSVRRPLPAKPFMQSLERCVEMVASLSSSGVDRCPPEVRLGNATALQLEDESVDAVVSHPPYIGSVPYAEYGLLSLVWLGHDVRILDKQLTGGKRQSRDVVERFRDGYRRMILESYRVLKPSGRMFLMVGTPVVRGERIDLAAMTRELAAEVGFHQIAESSRVGVNRRANVMGAEALLFFEKG
jgi:site-specific DNA-methyltransferase (cytosine-N4-specific)